MAADPLHAQKTCELHVHTGGCLTAADLLHLARDCYQDIDWSLFVDSYKDAFSQAVDPIALFEAAARDASQIKAIEDIFVYSEADGGDFGRFQAKFNLLLCVIRHVNDQVGNRSAFMETILQRHRDEQMRLVEYRCMVSPLYEADEFIARHTLYAQQILDDNAKHPGHEFQYIISLLRGKSVEAYGWVKQILRSSPQLRDVIVGLDFCHVEEGNPPKQERELFELVAADNDREPSHALGIVYHVGESYFDKSLESAIRWCHEAAMFGAKRLGHCIALGLDPEVAIGRREGAHENETVGERLDQIAYDLAHAEGLRAAGALVDEEALSRERLALEARDASTAIARPYDSARLDDVRLRQDYVLGELVKLGTVIETCPASNLRIGGVPDAKHHPIHKFLASDVNLAIGADDPGVFACTLADEVDWVVNNCNLSASELAERLGDPARFRLR